MAAAVALVLRGAACRAADGRGELGRRAAETVLDGPDVLARVPRPGQTGRREQDESGHRPQADRAVPREGAAARGRTALRYEERTAVLPASAEPEQQTAEGDHPQPARGELTVVAADFTEVQIAVQAVDPGAQREGAGASVAGQLPAYVPGVRVHEDGQRGVLGDVRVGHQDPGGRPGFGAGPDGGDGAVRVDLAGDVHLLGERQGRLADGDLQLVRVHHLLGLEGERVQQAARGGHEEEGGDEDARVEVEAEDEGAQCAPGSRLLRGGGRGGFRRWRLGRVRACGIVDGHDCDCPWSRCRQGERTPGVRRVLRGPWRGVRTAGAGRAGRGCARGRRCAAGGRSAGPGGRGDAGRRGPARARRAGAAG